MQLDVSVGVTQASVWVCVCALVFHIACEGFDPITGN